MATCMKIHVSDDKNLIAVKPSHPRFDQ